MLARTAPSGCRVCSTCSRGERLSVQEFDRELEHESGLAGLLGRSGDVRELLNAEAAGDATAALALAVDVHLIAGAGAAMAASLGGLDAVVFTAGVGERSPPIRDRMCSRLAFLGVELDARENAAATPDANVESLRSTVRLVVRAAREDLVVARAARRLVA
jgi:acetate kinase